jgi:CheY-like chemotaxis protein
MLNILVVDDSATDRRLFEGLLSKCLHFKVSTAEDGAVALKKMETDLPDVVVTDLQMPNMDGLQLVETIRSLHPLVPVILITGEGSEDIASKALQRGAAGYVPKSRCTELLRDTIEHVVEITRTESSFERLIDCATLSQFEFSFDNDFALIAPLLELTQRMTVGMGVCDETSCVQISHALEHAILNAIYHGNLQIGGPLSGDRALMDQRLSQAPYRDRHVHISIKINPEEARFVVRDEGPGFDTKEFSAMGRKSALVGDGGRGLFLMWAFMDSVTFDTKGSTVTMIKRRAVADQHLVSKESKTSSSDFRLPAILGTLRALDGGESIQLKKPRIVAGRGSNCDIVIKSSSISQQHCLLYTFEGWWYVRDLKSVNGIRVNHVSFNEHLLRPGNTLSIGKYEYKIDYEPISLGAEGIDPPADPF